MATTPAEAVPIDPQVAGPDFVVQIRDISGDTPCLTEDRRQAVQEAIASSFGAAFPGAYVDSTCAGGPDPANEAASFGVWLTAPSDPSSAHALLDTSIGRAQNEAIAFYINATLFQAAADRFFPSDEGGSIDLHPPALLEFRSPDTIVTRIKGVDTDPVPDASFTVTIDERFAGGPRQTAPAWYSATTSLDVDSEWVYAIEAWLSVIPLAFSPFFLPLTFAAWYQVYEVYGEQPSAQGVGSSVASLVMPLSIPIPGGLKIPVQYALREDHNGGVQVDTSGMYVGGFLLSPVPREPSVELSGLSKVGLHMGGGDVDDTIRALTTDMRGNLSFAWTVNGEPVDSNTPEITLYFNPSVGPFTPQNLAVTVTDADGLVAEASMQVIAELEHHKTVDGSGTPLHPA